MLNSFREIMGRNPNNEEYANLRTSVIESGVLKSLVSNTVNKKLTSVEAQAVLYHHYDVFFGICDHSDEEDVFSLIGHHDAEKLYGKESRLSERARAYIDLNIKKYLGLSFNEFIELSRNEQEQLRIVCEEAIKKELKEKDKVLRDIKELENEDD